MRIASLLPSATEIVCALGLRDQLVGISHSCDHPDDLGGLPILTRTAVDDALSSREIDDFVRRYLGGAKALYELDLGAMEDVRADLVVSQRLCDVCAVSMNEVEDALCALPGQPALVDLEPSCWSDVCDDLLKVAAAAGRPERGRALVDALQARLDAVAERNRGLDDADRPRVAVVEWLDPPFNSGHWVPELVDLAGGVDVLGPKQAPSTTISWKDVLDSQPDVVLLSVCGFDVSRTRSELDLIESTPGWQAVLEACGGRVLLIDGNAYFTRPGPRLVDATEALAHALHPDRHPPQGDGARVDAL